MKYMQILIIGLLFSCNLENVGLKNDKKINEIFNENEIEKLSEIISFFDGIVTKNTGIENIDSAYHNYCENLRYSESYDEFWKKIFMNKIEIQSFLNQMEKDELYKELWIKEYGLINNRTDTISIMLSPNWQGKYIDLIDCLIENDSIFIFYKESILASGTIPPSTVGGFHNIHPKMNFKDEKIRLIFALHFITINSEIKIN